MVKLLVNLQDDREVVYDNLTRGSIGEIIDAAKLLHPTWTSMELILVKLARETT